jgi:hypothetical protein
MASPITGLVPSPWTSHPQPSPDGVSSQGADGSGTFTLGTPVPVPPNRMLICVANSGYTATLKGNYRNGQSTPALSFSAVNSALRFSGSVFGSVSPSAGDADISWFTVPDGPAPPFDAPSTAAPVAKVLQKVESGSADASLLSFTPASARHTYRADYDVSVLSATSGIVAIELSWTDAEGTPNSGLGIPLQEVSTVGSTYTWTLNNASDLSGSFVFDTDASGGTVTFAWVGGGTIGARVSVVVTLLQ